MVRFRVLQSVGVVAIAVIAWIIVPSQPLSILFSVCLNTLWIALTEIAGGRGK